MTVVHPDCRAAVLAELDTLLRADLSTLITFRDINVRASNKAQAETCRVQIAGVSAAIKAVRAMSAERPQDVHSRPQDRLVESSEPPDTAA